ncbi:MAG: hypothetical protein U5J78_00235 [Parasphingorhabdus sp.]|nr:hypothetical protein [Parasphingorhabdus sp.]
MTTLNEQIEQARQGARHRAEKGKVRVKTASDSTAKRATETREKVTKAAESAREKLADSVASARIGAGDLREKSANQIAQRPLTFVAGGIALGLLIGALLPRSRTEAKYVTKARGRLVEGARGMIETAQETGKNQLSRLGDSDTGKKLRDDLVETLENAGSQVLDFAVELFKSARKK